MITDRDADQRGGVSGDTMQRIDVHQRIQDLSVEECVAHAEAHFARITDHEYCLTKPWFSTHEVTMLMQRFAQLLQGMGLLTGMTVIDFGAGSCWASRYLTQLGMKVIALDASPSALEIGRELYRRLPVVGVRPPPQFLVFDGHRIALPDGSVDRVVCFDAFHHVPNPAEILGELARVLREGGVAGFAEPGPEHSKSGQSQYEMRHHQVIENDVVIDDIWQQARQVGFTSLQLAVHNPQPFLLDFQEFNAFLNGEAVADRFLADTRAYMQGVRMFFLRKGEQIEPPDSRQPTGLKAELTVWLSLKMAKAGEPLRARARAANTGTAVWLPLSVGIGTVRLGVHLFDPSGGEINLDYSRHPLTPGDGRSISPGETVDLEVEIPGLPPGRYVLEFDLVAEGVCWFELGGSHVVRVTIEVQ